MRRTSPPAARSAANEGPAPGIRALALHVLHGQSRERTRLSRFLHDEIAQLLSGAGMHLDILRMDLAEEAPQFAPRAAQVLEILEALMSKVRVLSYDLSPDLVERAGPRAALERLVRRSRGEFPGSLRLRIDAGLNVDTKAAVALFGIAAQALDNAVRHSGGDRIEVSLRQSATRAVLQVRDNGHGFPVDAAWESPRGIGLLVMEQYASQAGLSLGIRSGVGKGTVVRVLAPPEAANRKGKPDGIQRIVGRRS